ncbi:MAG: tetratricopeptide repeat protein [Elusimicrobiaceae bacterium]
MSDSYVCPNCGGESSFASERCEYCGTLLMPQMTASGVANDVLLRQLAEMEAKALKTPGDGKLQYALGEAYHRLGDYNRADKCLQKAAELLPTEPMVFQMLAWNAGIKGGWENDTVGDYLERALILNPELKTAQALKFLHEGARLYLFNWSANAEEIMSAFEKAVALDPENAYIYHYASRLCESMRQYDDAIRLSKQAAERALKDIAPGKEDARIFARLGYLRRKVNQLDEARKYLAQAINLDPDNAAVKSLLSDIG